MLLEKIIPRKKFLFKILSKILSRSWQDLDKIWPDLVRFGQTQVRFYCSQEIVSNSYKILQEFSRSCKILSNLDKILTRIFSWVVTTKSQQQQNLTILPEFVTGKCLFSERDTHFNKFCYICIILPNLGKIFLLGYPG